MNQIALPIRFSLLTLLGVFILTGCATMRPGFEEPNVTVSYFRPLPGEGAVPQFEIGLRVLNPNNTALELTGISYTVNIEGNKLITGVGNDLPVIEAYGEAEFKLTAAVSLFGGIQLMRELMGGPQETLTYEFKAKLDPGPLQPAIRVKETGEFSLQPAS